MRKDERYGQDLRFLKRRNTKNTADVYRSMISDYIRANGVDCVYFRRGYTNFGSDAEKRTADPVYGADPTAPYTVKASMVVFMEMMADSYLLNRFGIQSEAEVQAYIGIRDFVEKFKPYVGRVSESNRSVRVRGDLRSGRISGVLDCEEAYGEVSGEVPASLEFTGEAVVTGMRFRPLPRPKNSLFRKPRHYGEGGCRSSSFSAVVKVSADGTVSGVATGTMSVPVDVEDGRSDMPSIRPQVGDLLVLDNPAGMIRDAYEITRVDRRAQGSNLVYNPLLDAYCFIVTCVQHRDSYEDVRPAVQVQDDPQSVLNPPGSVAAADELDTSVAALHEVQEEVDQFAEDQFDYRMNGNGDREYGGY